MLRFVRSGYNYNQGTCVFQSCQEWVLHRTGIAYFSTEINAKKVESDSKAQNDQKPLERTSSKAENEFPDVKAQLKFDHVKTLDYSENLQSIGNMLSTKEYIKLIEKGTASEASQILHYLTRKKFKSPEVFKAISFKICNAKPGTFTIKNCSDILYCAAVSSYKDEDFLTKVCSQILENPLNKSSRIFSPLIIRSLGSLKFKDNELIEALLKNILEFPSSSRNKDLLTSLMTLSIVNFNSPYVMVLKDELGVQNSENFAKTKEYLQFVWSLVLTNDLDCNHISNTLSKSYVDALKTLGGVSGISEAFNLKLQNINAAATLLIHNYQGPFLCLNEIYSRPLMSKAKLKYLETAVDGLCHIFPKNGHLKTCNDLKVGFPIDIEFAVDSQGNPTPLRKPGIKVAVVLLDFNDFCLGKEKTLTGISAFKIRILEALKYKVIKLSYKEYNQNLSLDEKVQYLKQKIKDVCVK